MKIQLYGRDDQLEYELTFLLRCRWDDARVQRVEAADLAAATSSAELTVVEYGADLAAVVALVEQLHRDRRRVILVASLERIPVTSQIALLRAGADDVWGAFPPDIALGIARFVALQRRATQDELLRFARLSINAATREVVIGRDRRLQLTPAEFRLLYTLVSNRERVLSFDELMDGVWDEPVASRSALRKLVQRLREKIGRQAGVRIDSQTGIGYRMIQATDDHTFPQGILQG